MLPFAFIATTIAVSHNSSALPLPLLPVTLVTSIVAPGQNSSAVSLPVVPLAVITTTVVIGHEPLALRSKILDFAFVSSSITICDRSFPHQLASFPSTVKSVSLRIYKDTLAMKSAIAPLAFVSPSIGRRSGLSKSVSDTSFHSTFIPIRRRIVDVPLLNSLPIGEAVLTAARPSYRLVGLRRGIARQALVLISNKTVVLGGKCGHGAQ